MRNVPHYLQQGGSFPTEVVCHRCIRTHGCGESPAVVGPLSEVAVPHGTSTRDAPGERMLRSMRQRGQNPALIIDALLRARVVSRRPRWLAHRSKIPCVGLIALLILVGACDSRTPPTSSDGEASIEKTSSELPTQPAVSPPPASYPEDLPIPQLKQKLACGKGSSRKACAIVDEFATAQRFTGKTPSGESRWLGRARIVESGNERTEYMVLYVHTVPTARVGANSLPLMLGMSLLPRDARHDAARVFGTLSRSRHRANRNEPIMRLVETYVPKTERGLVSTKGASVQTIEQVSEDASYLRQPELKKLLLIKPALGMDAKPGDGTYAEFWQTAW